MATRTSGTLKAKKHSRRNLWVKALEVKRRHLASLLRYPGVTGVDVGLRLKGGVVTREIALRVHVRRKWSRSRLPSTRTLPNSIEGIPLDVIEAHYGLHSCPDETLPRRIFRDPLVGGISVGNADLAEFGTLGGFVKDEQDTNYILSCHHVLIAGGRSEVDIVLQPAPGQTAPPNRESKVAEVTAGILDKRMDAAVARLTTERRIRNDMMPIGAPTGIFDPIPRDRLPLPVTKVGACTGVTRGLVDSVDLSVKVEYPQGIIQLENQIHIIADTPGGEFSRDGDSGALVVETATRRVIGLLCAGETTGEAEYGVASPIRQILEEFKVSFL